MNDPAAVEVGPKAPLAARQRSHFRLRGSLTVQQAAATLLVVLAIGLAGSLLDTFLEWRKVREDAVGSTSRDLEMIRASAVEAAYQLNAQLAARVVDGLFVNPAVERAVLADNFGHVLAARDRQLEPAGPLARRLFADISSFSVPLVYRGEGGAAPQEVGRVDLALSPHAIAKSFFDTTVLSAVLGGARALVICVLVVAVFTVLITRPILRLSQGVAAVDPDRPAAGRLKPLGGHGEDELGQLVGSFNALLVAFQRGLDARDRAEGELMALTRDLEQRVTERTRDLERARDALAHEKEETDRAFASLDAAHTELDKANRLLVEGIQYARRIQAAHLPDANALGAFMADLHVSWQPVQLVGGDYFWLEAIDGQAVLAVMDCTGHGVSGAFMTLVAASALDRALHEEKLRRPSEILAALDRLVRARLRQEEPGGGAASAAEDGSDDGLDAAICVFDPKRRSITFAGANLPLLYGKDHAVHRIRGTRASLGYRSLRPVGKFADHAVAVEPGMTFYLLTDGVHDQVGGPQRRLFGRRRLAEILTATLDKSLADQVSHVEHALAAWRGAEPRRDDMTLVAFRPLSL